MGKTKKDSSDKKGSASSQDWTPSNQLRDAKDQASGIPENATNASSSGALYRSGTPSAGPLAPPERPMLPPLLLTSDLKPELTRRPSPLYVYDWNSTWFFPMSLLAIVIIVAGMICMWAALVDRHAGRVDGNATNATAVQMNFSAVSTTTMRGTKSEVHAPGLAADPDLKSGDLDPLPAMPLLTNPAYLK